MVGFFLLYEVAEDYTCKLCDFGSSKKSDGIFHTVNVGSPLWYVEECRKGIPFHCALTHDRMAPEVKHGVYNFSVDIYRYWRGFC